MTQRNKVDLPVPDEPILAGARRADHDERLALANLQAAFAQDDAFAPRLGELVDANHCVSNAR
jgi:hypothetical protein